MIIYNIFKLVMLSILIFIKIRQVNLQSLHFLRMARKKKSHTSHKSFQKQMFSTHLANFEDKLY